MELRLQQLYKIHTRNITSSEDASETLLALLEQFNYAQKIAQGAANNTNNSLDINDVIARSVSTSVLINKRTARARAKLGQKICIIDPFHAVRDEDLQGYRVGFNPMARLTPDNDTRIEDAAQIADGLVIEAKESRDPHWDEEARGLIAGMTLYRSVWLARPLLVAGNGENRDFWCAMGRNPMAKLRPCSGLGSRDSTPVTPFATGRAKLQEL